MAEYPEVSAPSMSSAPEAPPEKKIIAWGNPVLKDDHTEVEAKSPPKYTPQVFKDQDTYETNDAATAPTPVIYSDNNIMMDQQPAYNPNSAPHGEIYNDASSGESANALKNYRYSMKEWVICTKSDPPGPETDWEAGRICELMMDKIVRVHLMSGQKISVDPLIGQIRPLSLAEVEEVKRNHKSDDIPMWCMICCFPCLLLITPLYFCGCIQVDGIIDCADCFCGCECCEDIGECCEECGSCITCGMC